MFLPLTWDPWSWLREPDETTVNRTDKCFPQCAWNSTVQMYKADRRYFQRAMATRQYFAQFCSTKVVHLDLAVCVTRSCSYTDNIHNVFRRSFLTNASTYLQNRDRHTQTWLKYLRLTPLRHTELNLTIAAMMIIQPRSPEVPGCSCPNVSGGSKTVCIQRNLGVILFCLHTWTKSQLMFQKSLAD